MALQQTHSIKSISKLVSQPPESADDITATPKGNAKKVFTFTEKNETGGQTGEKPSGSTRKSVDDGESNRGGKAKSILEEHGIVIGKVIGAGNYAKVKIGYSEEYGRRVAIKIISKVKAPAEYIQKFLPREIDAVKGLHHENLITFYQSIETSHRVYLIMQLAENGTLLDYVRDKKYLDEPQAKNLFKQLVSAVEYIHSKGVVHRDIKCENLLLDENWNIKLIDFGFARKDTRSSDNQVILSKTFCGSYAYASPEILKGVAYDPFLSDIWACGVVCYAMVFGRLPYDGSNVHVLLKRINASLVFPKNPAVTNECKHLIMHILAPLKMRYRIPQIKEDPWLSK
uniref:Protein kinase domain-containing protein n=1 Tax=Glossina brevipalpis TaxID=37001 RepID=A0A1A9W2K4_9MUSC